MAGRARCSLGAAALAVLVALPAPAEAAADSAPAAQAWLNTASVAPQQRPASRARRRHRRGRSARSELLGSRGVDPEHLAPAAIQAYGPVTLGRDGLVR